MLWNRGANSFSKTQHRVVRTTRTSGANFLHEKKKTTYSYLWFLSQLIYLSDMEPRMAGAQTESKTLTNAGSAERLLWEDCGRLSLQMSQGDPLYSISVWMAWLSIFRFRVGIEPTSARLLPRKTSLHCEKHLTQCVLFFSFGWDPNWVVLKKNQKTLLHLM